MRWIAVTAGLGLIGCALAGCATQGAEATPTVQAASIVEAPKESRVDPRIGLVGMIRPAYAQADGAGQLMPIDVTVCEDEKTVRAWIRCRASELQLAALTGYEACEVPTELYSACFAEANELRASGKVFRLSESASAEFLGQTDDGFARVRIRSGVARGRSGLVAYTDFIYPEEIGVTAGRGQAPVIAWKTENIMRAYFYEDEPEPSSDLGKDIRVGRALLLWPGRKVRFVGVGRLRSDAIQIEILSGEGKGERRFIDDDGFVKTGEAHEGAVGSMLGVGD